jgi:uncharacterized membrane protein YhaH (DUF805 family)
MFRSAFSFKGRSGRLEFALSLVLCGCVGVAIGLANAPRIPSFSWGIIELPFVMLFLAQGVKRCHDLGKQWWSFLIPFYVSY